MTNYMNHESKATRADGSPTLEARGYSWPDAEPGKFIALKHGVESPRVKNAVAEIIAEAVVKEAPWLEAESLRRLSGGTRAPRPERDSYRTTFSRPLKNILKKLGHVSGSRQVLRIEPPVRWQKLWD
jgi:hypothetical protein